MIIFQQVVMEGKGQFPAADSAERSVFCKGTQGSHRTMLVEGACKMA
jgi:hypothetical protein